MSLLLLRVYATVVATVELRLEFTAEVPAVGTFVEEAVDHRGLPIEEPNLLHRPSNPPTFAKP